MKNPQCTDQRSGFTLVEIAVALLVVAIGLAVVVGLFPAGLKANKVSIDETQMAMVAEEILNGVKAISEETKWGTMLSGNFQLPAPAENFWLNPSALKVGPASPLGNHSKTTHVFTYNDGSNIPAYAYRYNLQVVRLSANRRLGIKLQLWNGEQGPQDKGSVFYTEIFYNGNL